MNLTKKSGKIYSVTETEIDINALQQKKADLQEIKERRLKEISDDYDMQIKEIDDVLEQADKLE